MAWSAEAYQHYVMRRQGGFKNICPIHLTLGGLSID